MVAYIDDHRAEFGVESICRVLQIAPSTYYAAKQRQLAPSDRAVRDVVMLQVLMVLWVTNRKVYGAHKLWKAARRAGHVIGRDQVARLMRELDIRGVSRRRKVFTTRQDPDATRAPDLVNRDFYMGGPGTQWWQQMASAIAGGLVFATILTLVLTPSLLMIQANISRWFRERRTERKKPPVDEQAAPAQ